MDHTYREQWDRTVRWLERLHQADPNRDRDEYEDLLWACVQNCWHLKDWIINDPSFPDVHPRCKHYGKWKQMPSGLVCLECEVRAKPNLTICADIANRTKHYHLRGGGAERLGKISVGASTAIDYFFVLPDGTEFPALEVVEKALDEWRDLLTAWQIDL
jgi:hypothetical protein